MSISAIGGFSGIDPSQFKSFAGRTQGTPPKPEEFAAKLIEDLDTDGDGALSTSEIGAAERPLPKDFLTQVDTDGDGKVSKDELTADAEKKFAQFSDRSQFPPPALENSGNVDLSALLASSGKAAAAYRSNSLTSYLFSNSVGLNLNS